MRLTRRRSELRCSICHDALGRGALTCRSCATDLHAECSIELGRCPTLGCTGRAARRRRWWLPFVVTVLLLGLMPALRQLSAEPGPLQLVKAPKPNPRPGPTSLGGGVNSDELRRASLELMSRGETRTFMHEDVGQAPRVFRDLQVSYMSVEPHVTSMCTEQGRWFYVFTHRPARIERDSRWQELDAGVWEFRRR